MTATIDAGRSELIRRGLIVVLLCQIALAVWALDFGGLTSSANEPAPLVAPASELPLTLESGQATAFAVARSWHDDARLISGVMRVEWAEDSAEPNQIVMPDGGWIVYVFAADEESISLYFDRRSGAFITSFTRRLADEHWEVVDFTTHAGSSTIALLTADLLAGMDYRNACSESRPAALVTLSRTPDDSGQLIDVWTVTYGDERFDGTHDVLVRLDAMSGSVLTNEARARPCR